MLNHEILRLDAIIHYYGGLCVLDGISLTLHHGERAVLVGENGIGKTTLARIILGELKTDGGSVHIAEGARLGYLPQEVTIPLSSSVQDVIERALGDLSRIEYDMRSLETKMSEYPANSEALAELMVRYGELQEAFALRGGYEIDARRSAIFAGLEIEHIMLERTLATLSGGERTRVVLASLLLAEPDVLVLDEPTNHLDFAGITWLEDYLAQWRGALLVITHDRYFVNKVANRIFELDAKTRQLVMYHGTYDDYLAQRQRAYEQAVEAYHAQQSEMAQLRRTARQLAHSSSTKGVFSDSGDKFLKNFKRERGESLISKGVRDARQRLDDLEEEKLDNPRHLWRVRFDFNPEPLHSHEPLILKGLEKRYDERILFTGVDLTLRRGERVALIAPNGTGKSTLLRCIVGAERLNAGEIHWTGGAKMGYLNQDSSLSDDDMRVLDALRETLPADDKTLQAELHRSGLFTSAHLMTLKVGALSIGQRRKLDLARLIASRANVLLLDEPTNHLDLMSLEALESALINFDGALLAVTHDRRFINKVATQIWRIEGERIVLEV